MFVQLQIIHGKNKLIKLQNNSIIILKVISNLATNSSILFVVEKSDKRINRVLIFVYRVNFSINLLWYILKRACTRRI